MHTKEILGRGCVEIGTKFQVVERLTPVEDVDGLRQRQTLERVLSKTDTAIRFEDQGLTQGYIVFGQPGRGKTYFVKTILGQLVALEEEDPKRRYGGLIIDPKGDYPVFLNEVLKKLKRGKELATVYIYPGMKSRINILHCGLSPENLAKIVSATCSALAKGADEYFHNNLTVVLSALLVSKRILARHSGNGLAPSITDLLDLLSGSTVANGVRKQNLELYVGELEARLAPAAPDPTRERLRPGAAGPREPPRRAAKARPDLTAAEAREISRCVDSLRDFMKEEKAYVVKQLFKQAFEAFQQLDFLCGESKLEDSNIYDDIINSGRIVSVSIPPSETYAASVFTLMKNIYEKVILDRYARWQAEPAGAGAIVNDERPVFLICDEYHLSASDSPKVGVGDSTFLSLARSFGCFSLFATQGLEQLKTSALAERWEAVVGLFAAKFFFGVGDTSTATLACDLGGDQDSVFTGTSLNASREGRSFGSSDQLAVKQHLPKYLVLRSLARGQAAIVGTLDGVSEAAVHVVAIGRNHHG